MEKKWNCPNKWKMILTLLPAVSRSNNKYTGVLRFNSLRDETDNGATYNCTVKYNS